MSFSKITSIAGALALVSRVAAHGTVSGIVADGVYYQGYSPSMQYQSPAPVVVGWSSPEDLDNGFVAPDAYADPNIICHKGATNAQTSATVQAGGTVELQWTVWPDSHKGPVLDYLASCNGDCTTVDKTTLDFFKIDGVGLVDGSTIPGKFASDTLIANNNSWTVTIPSDIAPGGYVLRHEIIALHSAGSIDGAQNYPQCINLEVTGLGTATPSGTKATTFYTETDPGIEINIYQSLSTYVVPGPTLYSGATDTPQTGSPSATSEAIVFSSTSTPISSSESTTAILIVSTTSPVSESTTAAPSVSSLPTGTGFTRFSNSTTLKPFPSKTFTGRPGRPTNPTKPTTVVNAPTSVVSDAAATSTETVATSIPTSTPSVPEAPTDVTLPAGTTLNDVLSWISSFFTKHGSSSYTGSSVARRHARDVERRDAFNRFGGFPTRV